MNPFLLEKEKQELRNNRLKQVKQVENEVSKDIVSLVNQRKSEAEAQKVKEEIVEIYKKKLEEIEYLSLQKEKIINEYNKSKSNKENQEKMLLDFLDKIESKKAQFDEFMRVKGQDAIKYIKEIQAKKEQKHEEIHRIQTKKNMREEEKRKEIEISKKYKEILDQKQKDEDEDIFIDPKILHKKTQIYHPKGNKVDFSTTRFHSVVVNNHGNERQFLENQPNAIVKAEIENNKKNQRIKNKEISLEKFNKEIAMNSIEATKKIKAKENLKKLEDNLKGMRSKKIIKNNYESNNNRSINKVNQKFIDQDVPIEKRLELISKFCEDNSNNNIKSNTKNFFEDPVTRDVPMKEYINRLNPVDINDYLRDSANDGNNHLTHKANINVDELYSMKDIENILRIDNIMEKNSPESYQKSKQIQILEKGENENYKNSTQIGKKEQERPFSINKPVNKAKFNKTKENEELNCLLNIVKDNTNNNSKMNLKTNNFVDDFFNSLKNINVSDTKQNKIEKNQESRENKAGEIFEFDFKNQANKKQEVNKKINNINKAQIKEEIKEVKEIIQETKEDNNIPIPNPREGKFSKEELLKRRKEMIKSKKY